MFDAKDYANHVRREWAITSPRIRMSLISVLGEAGYTPATTPQYMESLQTIMEWIAEGLDDHCAMIEAMDNDPIIDLSEINTDDDGDSEEPQGYL